MTEYHGTTYGDDVCALAARVARCARIGGSPINAYRAEADIRALLETHALADLPAWYERFYGTIAWEESA